MSQATVVAGQVRKLVPLNALVSEEQRRALDRRARLNERSVAGELRAMLKAYLDTGPSRSDLRPVGPRGLVA